MPSEWFDFTFEGLYGNEHTREAQDANLSQSLRLGTLTSWGDYAQVGFWPFGNAHVNGVPGDQGVTSLDFSKPDKPPASKAPGNTLSPGVDDSARNNAHVLHELLARVQVAF